MDQERKREKEKLKKRRQREKLKQNQEKYLAVKSKDAERKKQERKDLKEKAAKKPRKFKAVLDKIRESTANRVRKFRERKNAENESNSTTPSSQKLRRQKEKERARIQEHREKEEMKKQGNRDRVNKHRFFLKIQLKENKKPESVNITPTTSDDGYKHRASEHRAYKRLENALPSTPAKKVRMIEKVFERATPRSRRALSASPTVKLAINNKMSRRRLSAQFQLTESMKQNFAVRNEKNKKPSSAVLASMKLLGKARKVSAVAAMLNISRKKLARSIKRDNVQRKPRNDSINTEKIELVRDFYLGEASREMPNKRDVLLIKDDDGKKQPVQKHIMEMTQTQAYQNFKSKNPELTIGQRKFDMLRPEEVRRTNISNRIVCCCTYCENIRLKLQTLKKVIRDNTLNSTSHLVDLTLCEKTGTYHSNKCIYRDCDDCGTTLLNQKYVDVIESKKNEMVSWKAWEKKRMPLDEERHVTRVVLVEHENTVADFFCQLTTALEPHAEHLFRASWQYDQFRENISNIKDGEVVMAMDFSENYTCRYGREIQSAHWNQKQITLHPMMLYYKQDNELKKEGFVAITDDLKHDAYAVSEFEEAAVKHLRDSGTHINKIHQWTDGCASQYKCRHSFAGISSAETTLKAEVTRNYFETSHGKGPCDGLGGIVKRKASNAVIKNNDITISSAKEMTKFCNENLKKVGGTYSNSRTSRYSASSRTFKSIERIDRSRITSAKTLNGSRKLHSVRSTGVNHQLEVRLLSCYCNGCRHNTNCQNMEYVEPWSSRVLKPVDESAATENMPSPVIQNQTETEVPIVSNSEIITNEPPSETLNAPQTDCEIPSLNDFVALKFVSKSRKICFFAKVCETEENEIRVEYLEKSGKHYQFSATPEESWQDVSDIICMLAAPDVIGTGSRLRFLFNLDNDQTEQLKPFKLM